MISNVSGIPAAVGPNAAAGEPAFKQAAQGFEAYLIQLLLKEMRETIPGGGMGGGGLGGDMFQSLTDQALADAVAKAGGIGLTQALMDRAAGDGRNTP